MSKDLRGQKLLPFEAVRGGSLLISRKPGQWVQIGDVRVRVIRGGAEPVLAIQAPRDVPIVRGELCAPRSMAEELEIELARRSKRRQQSEGRLTHFRKAA